MIKTSEIPDGVTADNIQRYVKEAYKNWDPAPTYLLLVGDVDKIPIHYRNIHPEHNIKTGSDLYYSIMYEGRNHENPDYSPDLFVGRLTVKTQEEARIVVDKILNYEKNPGGDGTTAWVKNILFAAYLQNDRRNYQTSRFFLQTSQQVREFMQQRFQYNGISAYTKRQISSSGRYYYRFGQEIPSTVVSEFISEGEATSKIIRTINEGCLIVAHRDHGNSRNCEKIDPEGWVHPRFTINDIANLTNGSKLPLFFSINCMSGWFDAETDGYDHNYDSLGEKLLRDRNKGCIGFIAATRVSYSGYNDELYKGFFDATWQDFNQNYPSPTAKSMSKLGQILNYGKLYMYNSRVKTGNPQYPWAASERYVTLTFEVFNLQGDPEVSLWTMEPSTFRVSYPRRVLKGASITVGVYSGGQAVPEALVCLMGERIYLRSKTNNQGNVSFQLTPSSTGTISITVTKHNYIPYEGVITIDEGLSPQKPDPYIYSQLDPRISQPIWDNPNIYIDEEENIRLKATIHNKGTVTADNTLVLFKWAKLGIGQKEWNLIGTTTVNIPANGTQEALIDWTPPSGILIEDCGFMVKISHPQDANTNNNKGIENCSVSYIYIEENQVYGKGRLISLSGDSLQIEIPFNVCNITRTRGTPSLEIFSLSNLSATITPPAALGPDESGTGTLIITLPQGIIFEMATFNVTGKISNQIIGGIEFMIIIDNMSLLSWVNEPGFESDGVNPDTGTGGDTFEFKVVYTDRDNDRPAKGYPKLHILLEGREISGSPFAMTDEITEATFKAGKIYKYSAPLLAPGTYTYFFEVMDCRMRGGTGTPRFPMEVRVAPTLLPPISLIAPECQSPNSSFWVDIKVGDNTHPVSNFIGMSLKLNYIGAIEIIPTLLADNVRKGELWGPETIFTSSIDRVNQVITITHIRKGTPTISRISQGVIANVRFRILPTASPGTTATLILSDIRAITSTGQELKFGTVSKEIKVIEIPITPLIQSPQSPGSEFWADVSIGSVTDLYSLSLEMKVSPAGIIIVPDPNSSFLLGDLMSSHVLAPIGEIDNQTGTLKIYLTRMGNIPGVNGKGNVLRIRFKVDDRATSNSLATLSISKAIAFNSNNESIGLTPGTTSFQIGGISVWPGDTNNDGVVNEYDILPIGLYWLLTGPARRDASFEWRAQPILPWRPIQAAYADANGDGVVNAVEILVIGRNWGKTHTVSASLRSPVVSTDIINHSKYLEAYKAMYELLENTQEESIPAIQSLKMALKKLITRTVESLTPGENELFQNYPNPFNPETFIPFQITEKAHVVIRIYNIRGELIRTLDLGVKEPGKYISKDKAAYWDGLNDDRQEVASGVYFYQIHAGNYVSVKQMVVLK